jgi:hypothetical protein
MQFDGRSIMNPGQSSFSPEPAGLLKPFGCVRALIFQFEDSNFPSIPATGFLLSFLGDVFFVTTKHAIVNAKLDTKDLCVPYSRKSSKCISFETVKTFSAADVSDTDQVDIIVMKANPIYIDYSLFEDERPFDISHSQLVGSYNPSLHLHFKGMTPEKNELNYEDSRYHLHFSSAPAVYIGETSCRSIHMAKANIPNDFPDFDGLSGSPLFAVSDENSHGSTSWFAGMLIQGTRSSQIIRFIEAERVANYLVSFSVGHLSADDGTIELRRLFNNYLKLNK